MDRTQAEALALEHLRRRSVRWRREPRLLTNATRPVSFGWVCFYTLAEAEPGEVVCGAGPLIVDGRSGLVHTGGTAQPVQYYVDLVERTGGVDEED